MSNPTAMKGPLIVYGSRAPLGNSNENPYRGPSIFDIGLGIFDHRAGFNVTRLGAIGMTMNGGMLNQVPSTSSTTSIAASQGSLATGVPMTLVSATGSGMSVVAAAFTVWASGNTVPVGALAVDSLPGLVSYGTTNPALPTPISLYDPSKGLRRGVSVAGTNGGCTGGNFLVSGADEFGYPMTQLLTVAAGVASATTLKAFKFIYSITPQFTDNNGAHTYIAGHTDLYGLPMRCDFIEHCDIYFGAVYQGPTTGTFTAAVTTSPNTNLLGDPRGTFLLTSVVANGTLRMAIFQQFTPAQMAAYDTGLWGVTPA